MHFYKSVVYNDKVEIGLLKLVDFVGECFTHILEIYIKLHKYFLNIFFLKYCYMIYRHNFIGFLVFFISFFSSIHLNLSYLYMTYLYIEFIKSQVSVGLNSVIAGVYLRIVVIHAIR